MFYQIISKYKKVNTFNIKLKINIIDMKLKVCVLDIN